MTVPYLQGLLPTDVNIRILENDGGGWRIEIIRDGVQMELPRRFATLQDALDDLQALADFVHSDHHSHA